MANTGPKTPPSGDPVVKSTPNAVGTAVISENIHTVGTNVDDLRQWIKRDIQDNKKCGIDEMLQELLYHCSDSKTDSKEESKHKSKQKETLLKNVLDDVFEICDDAIKGEMKECLSRFVNCKTEPPSYEPFVRAANYALDKLTQLEARGIIPPNDDNDRNIMFHHNDIPIKQTHQGVESQHKPDVVIVSHATARHVLEEGAKYSKHKPSTTNPTKEQLLSDFACKKPLGRFQWTDVLSYFEFKRLQGHNMKSPNYDDLNVSDAPTPQQHMLYGGKVVQSVDSTPPTQSASKEVGSRSLFIIVFRKLRAVIELSGDEFLRAWWQAVLCHRILWKRKIRHRDVSPSNIMYYRDLSGKVVGVLNDYDLSSINIVPSGRERTGTVPFMALDLLTEEAIEGKVEHLYQHDVESFIWVLIWVCLRYEDGKLRRNGRPLDSWLTVDARGCREKKSNFLLEAMRDRSVAGPPASHQANWQIALSCLRQFFLALYTQSHRTLDDESVFQTWLYSQAPAWLRDENALVRL